MRWSPAVVVALVVLAASVSAIHLLHGQEAARSLTVENHAVPNARERHHPHMLNLLPNDAAQVHFREDEDHVMALARHNALYAFIRGRELDLDALRKEISRGGLDMDCRWEMNSASPLIFAPLNGPSQDHVAALRVLLACGANPNSLHGSRFSGLHSLASQAKTHGSKRALPFAKVLLEAGTDPRLLSTEGKTAADYAPEGELRNLLQQACGEREQQQAADADGAQCRQALYAAALARATAAEQVFAGGKEALELVDAAIKGSSSVAAAAAAPAARAAAAAASAPASSSKPDHAKGANSMVIDNDGEAQAPAKIKAAKPKAKPKAKRQKKDK